MQIDFAPTFDLILASRKLSKVKINHQNEFTLFKYLIKYFIYYFQQCILTDYLSICQQCLFSD